MAHSDLVASRRTDPLEGLCEKEAGAAIIAKEAASERRRVGCELGVATDVTP